MIYDVYMSCGHVQRLELATTGQQLKIDLAYYARQGLCSECWKKLRAERAAEHAELQARRQNRR